SLVEGLASGAAVQMPFLHDPATQVRFLLAMPLLLIAEPKIGKGLGSVVCYLETSGITREEDRPKLRNIINDSNRWLGRLFPEILLLGLVAILAVTKLGAGLHEQIAPSVTNWEMNPASGAKNWAGDWYYTVSLPFYRFLMLRWFWRYLVWVVTLLRVSRLKLTLSPSHPDLAAGLGFFEVGQIQFGILAFALSTQLSGLMARKLLFEGVAINSFSLMILTYLAFLTLFLLAPLLVFIPSLNLTKRRGLLEFGVLGEKYTGAFERKWIGSSEPPDDSMLGSGDFQSLADLATGFDIVRRMRPCPFGSSAIISLVIAASLPFLPLLFFAFGFDKLLTKTLQMVF
ncbi:MAG TPA: hypothetical protein VJP40_04730, partial [bacterium]|nr:hypothetical protein [bacterium]